MTRSHADLIAENAILRQQLIVLNRQVKRLRFTNGDRFHLVLLARCTQFWQQALHIIQPDTLLRWHRDLFRYLLAIQIKEQETKAADSVENHQPHQADGWGQPVVGHKTHSG